MGCGPSAASTPRGGKGKPYEVEGKAGPGAKDDPKDWHYEDGKWVKNSGNNGGTPHDTDQEPHRKHKRRKKKKKKKAKQQVSDRDSGSSSASDKVPAPNVRKFPVQHPPVLQPPQEPARGAANGTPKSGSAASFRVTISDSNLDSTRGGSKGTLGGSGTPGADASVYREVPIDNVDFEDGELSIFKAMVYDPNMLAGSPKPDGRKLSLAADTENMIRVAASLRVKKGKQIGQGGFGKVYVGTREDDGSLVAIKTIEIGEDQEDARVTKEIVLVENEIRLLNALEHPNIVRYIGTAREEKINALNIYMEYVEGGTLAGFIHKHKTLDEAVTRAYTRQILEGLFYLHNNKIAHRDIKPANVLMGTKPWRDCSYTLKIADFGASKKINDLVSITVDGGQKTLTGTPHFMAPEVVLQSGHGRKADVWSVGGTIIEMMTGRPPWADQAPMAVLFRVGTKKDPPPMPDGLGEVGRGFLLQCFVHDHRQRPGTQELMRHRWFDGCPGSGAVLPEAKRVDRLLVPGSANEDLEAAADTVLASHRSPTPMARRTEARGVSAERLTQSDGPTSVRAAPRPGGSVSPPEKSKDSPRERVATPSSPPPASAKRKATPTRLDSPSIRPERSFHEDNRAIRPLHRDVVAMFSQKLTPAMMTQYTDEERQRFEDLCLGKFGDREMENDD